MERFLLLWDEFDDLFGASRHSALNLLEYLADARRDALGRLGGAIRALKPA